MSFQFNPATPFDSTIFVEARGQRDEKTKALKKLKRRRWMKRKKLRGWMP